jgi:hypothetical protein
VLCLESVDLPAGVALDDVRLDTAAPPVAAGDGAQVRVRVAVPVPAADRLPYGAAPGAPGDAPAVTATLVPYHRWAERGPSTMRVFLPAT